MLPIERAAFRSEESLVESGATLDALWKQPGLLAPAGGWASPDAIRTREAAAMLATARWVVRAAQERTETRGMHTRTDHPATDPDQTYRLLVGGLAFPWVAVDPDLPVTSASTPATAQKEAS
jgi:succinate dehydrogenase/fumarate reductase flavoprotein subunit